MLKLLAVISIFLALSAVHSQSCSSTSALRSFYGFGNSIATATTQSGVNYCKSIKTGPVCCTASDINSIADKSAAIVSNLTSMVATRDMFLTELRTNVLPTLEASLESFKPMAEQFEDMLAAMLDEMLILTDNSTNSTNSNSTNGTLDDEDFAELFGIEFLIYFMDEIADLSTSFIGNISNIASGYTAYQKARTGCVVEMMNLQNAAFCLACDPSASSKGFTYVNNTFDFTLSTRVCNRLKGACGSYLQDSVLQNSLIEAFYSVEILSEITTMLTSLMTGNTTALEDASSMADPSDEGDDDSFDMSLAPGELPEGCDDSSTCDWICDSLFYDGLVDQDSLVWGGILSSFGDDSEDGERRRLAEKANTRMLTSGSFDPDSDESGVTVTFKDDPGNTSKTKFGSLNMGNVMIGMMVMISSVLLL